MTPDLRYYLNQPYTVQVVPDCGTFGEQLYLASVVELPGCESHAETPEAALRNVHDAMALYIASMLEDGLAPPAPEEYGVSAVWSVLANGRHPALSATSSIPPAGAAAFA